MNFPAEGFQFLRDLSANNNRDWFQANKQIFQTTVQRPVEDVSALLANLLSELLNTEVNHKIFRIYRDVRFSKDKTPYNTHMRVGFWAAKSKTTKPMAGPGFYLSFEPHCVHQGAGCIQMPPDMLTAYRQTVSMNGDTVSNLVQSLQDNAARFDPPALKRVPAGYDKNHLHEALLRRKGLTGWHDRDITEPEAINTESLLENFKMLLPVYHFMESL